MLVLILVAAALSFWYLQFIWSRKRLYHLASQVPGPKPWPLIGNALEIMWDPSDIYNSVMRLSGTYPDLIKTWFGPILVYGIYKPEYLEVVLNSPHALTKMFFYRFAEPLIGWGLTTAPVPIWKRHRKIIMPTFNQRILEAGVDIMNEESMVLVEQLLNESGKGFFDLLPYIQKCVFDLFCGTAMGIKTHTQTTQNTLNRSIERMLDIVGLRVSDWRYHFDFTFNMSALKQEGFALVKEFNDVTERVLQERKKVYTEDSSKKIFLDMLLEASSRDENGLSDVELRDEVNTFVVAGTDTIAQSSCFLLLLLAMHPEIQDKVFDEIVDVVGKDGPVLYEHIGQLVYLEQVIKESLRLFPIGAFLLRDITGEIPLGDGIVLAKDTSVFFNIIHLHRNPKYWPDPLRFDPERFERDLANKRHPYAYLPFSGGPRNCPGIKYAMMTMKIMMGWMVRSLKFSTKYGKVEDVELRHHMMIRPVHGHIVAVEKR